MVISSQQLNLKKVDIFLLILFPVIAVWASLFIKANFLQSILLFFGLPSLYLSLRTPFQVKKTFLFSLILSIPFGIIIDYIAVLDSSWYVPTTVFPFRLLGIVPVEDLIWGFLSSIVLLYFTNIF